MFQQALKQVQSVASAAAQFSREMALELGIEGGEALRTGLGIPRAITSVASLGCFAVAAAGTASITLDLVKKVYGQRVCSGCNGWETLVCRGCGGLGRVAGDAGKGPSTSGSCVSCNGFGVEACGVCKGDAWKPRLTLDRVLDSPLKGWDAYRMCQPVTAPPHQRAIQELVESNVAALPVPPRPSDWALNGDAAAWERQVREALAAEESGRDSSATSTEEALRRACAVRSAVLDAMWAEEWRGNQVSEILQGMSENLARTRRPPKPATPAPSATAAAASGPQAAAAAGLGAAAKPRRPKK